MAAVAVARSVAASSPSPPLNPPPEKPGPEPSPRFGAWSRRQAFRSLHRLLYLILYMSSPFYRLYKTKLTLLAVICVATGASLLVLTSWTEPLLDWSWLRRLPAAEFGSGLLFTGVVAIFFQFWGWKDAQEHSRQEQERLIQNGAPAFVDAVVDALAFRPESLTNVASSETLDRIIRNCLGLRLGDQQLAHDVYADLRQQVVRARSRNYDAQVSVALAPWNEGPPSLDGEMFTATIRWQYEVESLSSVMRFSCVSDEDEYRRLLQDPTSTTTWYFKPAAGLNGGSPDAFELVQFAIDGVEQKARRTARAGTQVYTVHIDSATEQQGERHKVSYSFRALVRRRGHVLHLDIARPTKGLNVEFFYGGCGIQSVRVLDYIASAKQPHIASLPPSAPTPSVSLSFDGWVWPKGGFGFVWSIRR